MSIQPINNMSSEHDIETLLLAYQNKQISYDVFLQELKRRGLSNGNIK